MFDVACFSWIALCFALSFRGGVPLAAGLTLCADFFLIFTQYYAVGLALFLLVQMAYIRHLRGRAFRLWYLAALPFAACLPVPVLGCAYALLLLCHFYFAIKKAGADRGAAARLYALALVLFAACDVAVAWGYFNAPAPGVVWLFYAPSQLLLALTARPWRPPRRPSRPRKGR